MDWLHCNVCHLQQETIFYITSCGHILCQACINRDYCSVCRTACKYLPISENLKPQEKMYFRSPKDAIQKYFNNIAQAWSFQKQQHELHLMYYKQYLSMNQNSLQIALQKIDSQENELKAVKKENAELRSLVTHLKGSLSRSQSNSRPCTPRPVAITSPSQTVTPQHSSHSGQVVSRSSSVESYVRSHSGTSSQPTSANRLHDRSTPMSSSQDSPISGHSIPYRLPSQTTNTGNFSYSNERSNVSGIQTQSLRTDSNTLRTSSAVGMEPCIIPSTNIDRLRAIQLKFTPKMPVSQMFRR